MKRLFIGIATLVALFVWAVAVLRKHEGPGEGVLSERPLDTMTRDELYDLAREQDLPGRSKMKKSELVAALSRAARSG